MANSLTVQLVKLVELDDAGNETGETSYGFVASDEYERDFFWGSPTFAALATAIDAAGGTLPMLGGFDDADPELVGNRNYNGVLRLDDPHGRPDDGDDEDYEDAEDS